MFDDIIKPYKDLWKKIQSICRAKGDSLKAKPQLQNFNKQLSHWNISPAWAISLGLHLLLFIILATWFISDRLISGTANVSAVDNTASESVPMQVSLQSAIDELAATALEPEEIAATTVEMNPPATISAAEPVLDIVEDPATVLQNVAVANDDQFGSSEQATTNVQRSSITPPRSLREVLASERDYSNASDLVVSITNNPVSMSSSGSASVTDGGELNETIINLEVLSPPDTAPFFGDRSISMQSCSQEGCEFVYDLASQPE